jgi:hypothetical protein
MFEFNPLERGDFVFKPLFSPKLPPGYRARFIAICQELFDKRNV